MEEQQFLIIKDMSNIDILDENLYSYDDAVFGITSTIQNRTSQGLIRKVEQFIDTVPAVQKSVDYMKSKTEFIPRMDLIPEDIKQALQAGTAEIIQCKDSSDTFYLQIRSTVKGLIINGKEYGLKKKIKDIPLSTKNIPADVSGAIHCLSMQKQLNQISSGLKEISEVCELNFGRIIEGQRGDRIAKLLSSRSCFIQALAMSDEYLKKQMLMQAVRDANSARAELVYQIKSDISLLSNCKYLKSKDMGKIVCDINTAIVAMNNAVQISLYSYQALAERNAQLSIVKEHESFIKQVLLKKVIYNGNKCCAWELIRSSGKSKSTPENFENLPEKLLDNCNNFISINNEKSCIYLEGKHYA